MRPLRLTMTAFGPYAGTEVVDFEALTGVGLFVVSGSNGAGKTTIFDALHFSLYGRLPGRRSNYGRLKSDHADDKTECKVTFEFAAHGKRWLVERTPAQTRRKKRGSGTTEATATAALFRLEGEGGVPIAVTTRIDEVRAKCTELVGLSGAQFERVALLPQGEFSRVLREKGTERRELLRTLFSSEIFDTATGLIAEQASIATAADTAKLERLHERRRALTEDLGFLANRTIEPTDDLAGIVADTRRALDRQQVQVDELTHRATTARRELDAGQTLLERIQRRAHVKAQLDAHRGNSAQHEHDLRRLSAGRSAVPVVNQARTVRQFTERHERASTAADDVQTKLARAVQRAGLESPDSLDEPAMQQLADDGAALAEQLKARHEHAQRAQDLGQEVARLHTQTRRKDNERGTIRRDKEVAASQLRQNSAELHRLTVAAEAQPDEAELDHVQTQLEQRHEMIRLEADHQALALRITAADADVTRLAALAEAATQAAAALPALDLKAASALEELATAERELTAARAYRSAAERITDLRSQLETATDAHDRLWDGFIAGTAARMATTLVDDEPCPVCGSEEHPAPAQAPDALEPVTQPAVHAARAQVDQLRDLVRAEETTVEHLLAEHDGLAATSATEHEARTSTAKAMALGARTLADETRQAASSVHDLGQRHTAAMRTVSELRAERDANEKRHEFLRGSLGVAANVPVADLQDQVETARSARSAAATLAAGQGQLTVHINELEATIEELELRELAADSKHTSLTDQLAQAKVDHDGALADVAAHDRTLATPGAETLPPEQRTQALRQMQELIAALRAASARQAEAADGLRQAQLVLGDRVRASSFTTETEARAAFIEPVVLEQLEAQTTAFAQIDGQLQGQLRELEDLAVEVPDIAALELAAATTGNAATEANRELSGTGQRR